MGSAFDKAYSYAARLLKIKKCEGVKMRATGTRGKFRLTILHSNVIYL